MRKVVEFIRKKYIITLIIILILLIVIVPLFIDLIIVNNNIISKATNDGWISFLGSYLGGIIGGAGTLISLLITTNQAKKHQEENRRDTFRIQQENMNHQYEMLELQKNNEIKTNAFIIKNDLLICFRDIFNILVRYAINNSKLTMEKEIRSNWIVSWKDIVREFEYSRDWRNELKTLSKKISTDDLFKIYELYVLLDETRHCLGSITQPDIGYEKLYRNIEMLPKEYIFNKNFVNKYNNLRYQVDEFDSASKNNKKGSNDDLNKETMKNSKEYVYKEVEFFKNIEKQAKEDSIPVLLQHLDKKWITIFDKLDKVINME